MATRIEDATDIDLRCVAALRALAIDAVEAARSGHPGAPLGMAPAAYVLWTRFLRHDPADPAWPDRDRFVLSAGHASALLYSLLHLSGYDLSLDDLRRFRRLGSRTPGHPEFGHTPGVETTTGPLGQGFGNAVGMAMAERLLAARHNRPGLDLFDHRTYVLCSDGDLMEGIASEAASLAGHLGLGKLVVLYDDNGITIDGSTSLAFTEDVPARFRAYGWRTLEVKDGNDLGEMEDALIAATSDHAAPTLISVRTEIGFGSPNKAGTAGVHGAPLGEDELALTKDVLGWPRDPAFFVSDDVRSAFAERARSGAALSAAWRSAVAALDDAAARALRADLDGGVSEEVLGALPHFHAGSSIATRKASERVLEAAVPRLASLAGGSADLSESNGLVVRGEASFATGRAGRVIHFGVREHAMGAILNGLALHGGVRPYGGTFMVFSDYMRPSIRLAALMGLPVIYVFSHDSVGLGEDGPTHQPVEHLAALRAIPNLNVIRPADATETVEAWKAALRRSDGPTALCLTRQGVPVLERAPGGAERGAYVLDGGEDPAPDAILIGTGSEVHVVLAARDLLPDLSVRVVSMPSWEIFAAQPHAYRDEVLPPAVRARVAVEAGCSFGWERWIGDGGATVTIDSFGASGPGADVLAHFGFTAENVAARVRALLGR